MVSSEGKNFFRNSSFFSLSALKHNHPYCLTFAFRFQVGKSSALSFSSSSPLKSFRLSIPFQKGDIRCDELPYDQFRGVDVDRGLWYIKDITNEVVSKNNSALERGSAYGRLLLHDNPLVVYMLPCDRTMYYNATLLVCFLISFLFTSLINSLYGRRKEQLIVRVRKRMKLILKKLGDVLKKGRKKEKSE
jgi:hypothetical protein